jgi:hypothetical protein
MSEKQKQFMTVVLIDDETGNALPVFIEATSGGISIKPHGYGDFSSADGEGCPLFIEFYANKLSVVIHDDINEEDPNIFSLEGAKESARKE